MSRQAFLIIAHDNFLVLERLVKALLHPDVDIYLHLDAKVKELPAFIHTIPRINLIINRVDTRWGDVSQIDTEYALLKEAYRQGGYSHYHIISGTHFLLEPIDKVLDTFKQWEGKTVFNGIHKDSKRQEYFKLRRYNFCTRYLAYGPTFFRRGCQILRRWLLNIQAKLKIERNKDMTFYKASNWASFSEEAVKYLIENYKEIRKVFSFTFCGDEFFAPTFLMISHLKENLVSYNKYLKQRMGRANAIALVDADYQDIVNSGCLFARKFTDKNISLVDKIIEKNRSEKEQ